MVLSFTNGVRRATRRSEGRRLRKIAITAALAGIGLTGPSSWFTALASTIPPPDVIQQGCQGNGGGTGAFLGSLVANCQATVADYYQAEEGLYPPGPEQLAAFNSAQDLIFQYKHQLLYIVALNDPRIASVGLSSAVTVVSPPTSALATTLNCPSISAITPVSPPPVGSASAADLIASPCTQSPPSDLDLSIANWAIQPTNYTCGPTSAHNALLDLGANVDINTLASQMHTGSQSGTGRSDMPGPMNRAQGQNPYYWHDAPHDGDVWALTKDDIWYSVPPIFNFQAGTWNTDPKNPNQGYWTYPFPVYQGYPDVRHYITGYGYHNNGTIDVFDENDALSNHTYNYAYHNVWQAIQNLPFPPQVLW